MSLIVAVSPALGAFPGRNGALLMSASTKDGYAYYLAGPGSLVRWLDGDKWSAGTFTADGASVLVSRFTDVTLFMASALPGARPISLHRRGKDASLSADGRWIALLRWVAPDEDGEYRVFVAARAGGAPRLLADDGDTPRWSSQGRLAFTSSGRVMVTDVHARHARRVADGWFHDWSPSGRRLLVTRVTDSAPTELSRTALYAIGADGQRARRLTTFIEDRMPASAVWSPDGRKIAFLLFDEAGKGAIYTISARSRSPQGPHAWHKIITQVAALHDWQPVR